MGHSVYNKQLVWVNRIFSWINTTFPHPGHQVFNKAIPAVNAAYVSPCLNDLLPPDVDLVLMVSHTYHFRVLLCMTLSIKLFF